MPHHARYVILLLALLAPGANPARAQEDGAQEQAEPRPSPAQPEKETSPAEDGKDENPYVRRFRELDANRDGHVTLDEWPLEEAKFHVVDRDQDGRLSPTELLTPNVLRHDPFEARFRELDRDRDGRLSGSELERGGEGPERGDRDRDGYVSRFEYRNVFENTWNPRSTFRDQRRFQHLDRNRDNRLSRMELGGSRAAFDRLDRNRDGVLSPREWQ